MKTTDIPEGVMDAAVEKLTTTGPVSLVTIDAGHELTLERPDEVNEAIANWLSAKGLA